MHLELATQEALTGGEPWSAETLAVRRARGSGRFPATTPKDLLLRAQRADAGAVSTLVGTYRDAICSFLRSRGAREHEAPDVTQGTLLGMWRGLGRFRPEESGSFRAWLCKIAMNQLFNFRRKEGKHRWLQEPSAPVEREPAALNAQRDERPRRRALASTARLELERQLTASHAQCCEQEVRRRRALETIDRVWQRAAEPYRDAGKDVLFDYLYDSIHTGIMDRDAELSRELADSDDYIAKARHDLLNVKYRKALLAEYRHLHQSKRPQGSTPPPSFKEWTRALHDDLA